MKSFYRPIQTIAYLVLFVSGCTHGHLQGIPSVSGFITGSSGIFLSDSEDFTVKPHAALLVEGGFDFVPIEFFGISACVMGSAVSDSTVGDGVSYRAFDSLSAVLDVAGRYPIGNPRLFDRGVFGILLGGMASIARYSRTSQFFFFPSLRFGPFYEFSTISGGPFVLRLGTVTAYHFRRDLIFSFSQTAYLSLRFRLGST